MFPGEGETLAPTQTPRRWPTRNFPIAPYPSSVFQVSPPADRSHPPHLQQIVHRSRYSAAQFQQAKSAPKTHTHTHTLNPLRFGQPNSCAVKMFGQQHNSTQLKSQSSRFRVAASASNANTLEISESRECVSSIGQKKKHYTHAHTRPNQWPITLPSPRCDLGVLRCRPVIKNRRNIECCGAWFCDGFGR